MARRPKVSTTENFLSRVDHMGKPEDACWDWMGGVNNAGYGRLMWNGRRAVAHRVMASLVNILPDIDSPEFVSHTCKNRRCCNPKHLKAV